MKTFTRDEWFAHLEKNDLQEQFAYIVSQMRKPTQESFTDDEHFHEISHFMKLHPPDGSFVVFMEFVMHYFLKDGNVTIKVFQVKKYDNEAQYNLYRTMAETTVNTNTSDKSRLN